MALLWLVFALLGLPAFGFAMGYLVGRSAAEREDQADWDAFDVVDEE